jgi:hypothetical protein
MVRGLRVAGFAESNTGLTWRVGPVALPIQVRFGASIVHSMIGKSMPRWVLWIQRIVLK